MLTNSASQGAQVLPSKVSGIVAAAVAAVGPFAAVAAAGLTVRREKTNLTTTSFRPSSWRPSLASRHELMLGLLLLSLVLGPSSWWPSQLFPVNCQHAYDTCPSHMYACI